MYNFVSKKRFIFYTHQPFEENYVDTSQMNVKLAKISFGCKMGTLLQICLKYGKTAPPRDEKTFFLLKEFFLNLQTPKELVMLKIR